MSAYELCMEEMDDMQRKITALEDTNRRLNTELSALQAENERLNIVLKETEQAAKGWCHDWSVSEAENEKLRAALERIESNCGCAGDCYLVAREVLK